MLAAAPGEPERFHPAIMPCTNPVVRATGQLAGYPANYDRGHRQPGPATNRTGDGTTGDGRANGEAGLGSSHGQERERTCSGVWPSAKVSSSARAAGVTLAPSTTGATGSSKPVRNLVVFGESRGTDLDAVAQ